VTFSERNPNLTYSIYMIPPTEFLVAGSKVNEFKRCLGHIDPKLVRFHPERGTYTLKLRWELLVQFGSREQLKRIDAQRVAYIHGLIDKHCKPLIDCHTTIVGSRSPKSNIDINMTCPQHMEEVLHAIFREHKNTFPDASMEEMFDTNIYGSVFQYLDDRRCKDIISASIQKCYPRFDVGYRQHMWGFLRIVEMCEDYMSKGVRHALVSSWSPKYQKLYADTLALRETLKRRRNTDYVKAVSMYLKELAKKHPDPHRISERFSASKTLEHDTYRSIGAVLHIVDHRKDLPVSSMYDSCYDNLGFVYQALLKTGLCGPGAIVYRVIKSAKYIERVVDAIQVIFKNAPATLSLQIKQLEGIAVEINRMRKALAPMKDMLPLVHRLYAVLGIHSQPSTPQVLRAITECLLV
jgi:hypothetical protein